MISAKNNEGFNEASGWRDLYLAALFEINPVQMPPMIDRAERAVIARSRQLFSSAEGARERNSLHSALQALRALRECNAHKMANRPRRAA